jgi:hypothetical protein
MRKQTDSFKVHKISTMEETKKRGKKCVGSCQGHGGWVLGIRSSPYLGGDKFFVIFPHKNMF